MNMSYKLPNHIIQIFCESDSYKELSEASKRFANLKVSYYIN